MLARCVCFGTLRMLSGASLSRSATRFPLKSHDLKIEKSPDFLNCLGFQRIRAFSVEAGSEEKKKTKKKKMSKALRVKHKQFEDEDSNIIFDMDNDNDLYDDPSSETTSKKPFYLYQEREKMDDSVAQKEWKRGVKGVFDVHEIVEILKEENMKDIVVIYVPPEIEYCEYMVIASVKSSRQLNAFSMYLNKVYKKKKNENDKFLQLEGREADRTWRSIDMGNIVLHLFQGETRDLYDLETLWTCGRDYDDKTQRPEKDVIADLMDKHIKYLEDLEALPAQRSESSVCTRLLLTHVTCCIFSGA